MIRISISFDEEDYRAAKAAAKREGIPLSEFFRRSVRLCLPTSRDDRPWMRHAGTLSSGDSKSSRTVDVTLYRRSRR